MTPQEIETLNKTIDRIEEKLDLFRDDVEHKFNVVFDELYAIRHADKDSTPSPELPTMKILVAITLSVIFGVAVAVFLNVLGFQGYYAGYTTASVQLIFFYVLLS